jgi:hypothetical protein
LSFERIKHDQRNRLQSVLSSEYSVERSSEAAGRCVANTLDYHSSVVNKLMDRNCLIIRSLISTSPQIRSSANTEHRRQHTVHVARRNTPSSPSTGGTQVSRSSAVTGHHPSPPQSVLRSMVVAVVRRGTHYVAAAQRRVMLCCCCCCW